MLCYRSYSYNSRALNVQLLELLCRHSAGKKNCNFIAHRRGEGKDLTRYFIFTPLRKNYADDIESMLELEKEKKLES